MQMICFVGNIYRRAQALRKAIAKMPAKILAVSLAGALTLAVGAPWAFFRPSAAWAEDSGIETLQRVDDNANGSISNIGQSASADDSAASQPSQSPENAQGSAADIAQLDAYYLTNDGFVTPVRLQNPWGSCWAFAIAAALESSILKAEAELGSTQAPGLALQGNADYMQPQLTGLNTSIDISERAIGWFAHELQTEASGGPQAGEGNQRTNASDPTTQMSGGSFTNVESMLTARQAMVAETSAPYAYNGYSAESLPWYALPGNGGDARAMDWSLPDTLRISSDVGWEVRDVLRLTSPSTSQFVSDGSYIYQGYHAEATQMIKETLADVGAVAIALAAETALPQEVIAGRSWQAQPSDHFTYATWSQHDASETYVADHAVAIVGWDDSYSASNFAGGTSGQPPADGAWLCKNDWGSDALFAELGAAEDVLRWGIPAEDGSATGFFWLSYYDHTISAPTAFVVQPADESYDVLYQHDYLGNSEFYIPSSYEQDLWVANVFMAEDTELLKAVSAQTFGENDTVKLQIYTISGEGTDVDILESAHLVYEAEETFPVAGFHTIDLENPVLIAKEQRFAIMESVSSGTNPDARYLNLELAFTMDPAEAGLETFASVVANDGETYVDLYGKGWVGLEDFNIWYADHCAENSLPVDVTYGNALIKAYANDTTMGTGTSQTYELVNLW